MHIADTKRLTHQGAKTMVDTAVAKARAAGIAISCAVVDAGGHLIAFERMDGGRFHKRVTSAKGAVGQELDTNHALGLALAAGADRWTAMEGGAPVLVGTDCIGGIGVSGGDWATDERIAREAVEAVGANWK
jgi:glc operon protein GlcG